MFKLSLRAESGEYISLDAWLSREEGVQILSGVTGLGMPFVANQWLEGAGDGAIHRGRRFLPRTLDLPIMLTARYRDRLEWWARRLSRMFTGEVTVYLVDDEGMIWWLKGVYEGGADYTYGEDTIGTEWLYMTITLKCGYPFWTRSQPLELPIIGSPSGSGATYTIKQQYEVNNPGDVDAPPRWIIDGPASSVTLTSHRGKRLVVDRPIPADRSLIIDTSKGTVTNDEGGNWYDWLGPAPSMWSMRPGMNDCTIEVTGANRGTPSSGSINRTNYFPNPMMVSSVPIYAPNLTVVTDSFYSRFIVGAGKSGWGGMKVPYSELAGKTLTLTTRAYIESGPKNAVARVRIFAYDGSTYITSYNGEWGDLSGSSNLFSKSFTADPSATILYCVIEVNNSGGSTELRFDTGDWMLEVGMISTKAFSGSTQDNDTFVYDWDGDTHNSISRERDFAYSGATQVRCEIQPRQAMMV